MADFHFAMDSMADAQKFAEALKGVAKRPEVVVLRIMILVEGGRFNLNQGRARHQALGGWTSGGG